MSSKPKVSVCGCGTGGATLAAYLTHKGYDVNVYEYPEFAETTLKPFIEQDGIDVKGALFNGLYKPNTMTTDIREAIQDTEIIMIVSRAAGHTNFAEIIAPVIEEDQMLLCWTPYWFCMRHWDMFRKKAPEGTVFAEASIYPFMTRYMEPGVIYPDAIKNMFQVAAMPARDTKKLVKTMKKVLPQTVAASNVLETTIGSPNPSVHSAPTLLNMATWEKLHGDISFYQDLQSPAIGKVLEAQDKDKLALGEALGMKLMPLKDLMIKLYSHMGARGENVYEIIKNNQAHLGFRGNKELHEMTVVMEEDIPYGIVPMATLGKKLGVPTPTFDTLIHLATIVTDTDFLKTGTTPEKLGIANMNAKQILHYANTGEK